MKIINNNKLAGIFIVLLVFRVEAQEVLTLQNAIQNVQQIGNQNNYQYFSSYNSIQSNITVNQEGLLNSLQIFGENSLMKDVVINQKSDFKSMVIKNYTN